MEDKKVWNFPLPRGRVVLIILLVIILSVPVGKGIFEYFQEQQQIYELKKLPGYFVCSDDYGFYMLNATESDEPLLLLQKIFNSDLITELQQNGRYISPQHLTKPVIRVYVVLPNNDILYGFRTTYDELVYADWYPPWVRDYENLLIQASCYAIHIEETDTCWEDLLIQRRDSESKKWVILQQG